MARATFGGGTADFLETGNGKRITGTVTFWSAATGGTQYTDLLLAGVAKTSIMSDVYGYLPEFSGPDGILKMYADAGGGRRIVIEAHDDTLPTDAAVDAGIVRAGLLSAATASTTYAKPAGVDVKTNHGAKGDGVTDDTAAINAAFAASAPTGNPVLFPPGNYIYNGTGFDAFRNLIIGAGYRATTITLGSGSYLINTSKVVSQTILRGVKVVGGAGVLRYTGTAANVTETHVIEDCYFQNYTGCAVAINAPDMPYWKVKRSLFVGANYTSTMGFAHAGLSNLSEITGNSFLANRIGLKLKNGQDCKVRDNDFIRLGASAGSPRIDVWLVPTAALVNAHTGLEITGNKMGNENLAAGDWRIAIADEETLSGADVGTYFPKFTADSTGYVTFTDFDTFLYGSSGAPLPYIYSTTPNLIGCRIEATCLGTPPTRLVQYRTQPTGDRVLTDHMGGGIQQGLDRRQELHVARAGHYIYAPSRAKDAASLGLGQMDFSSRLVPGGVKFDRICCEVTTAGAAGSVIRLGLWADDGAGRPSILLLDCGTVDATTIGVKELVIDYTTPRFGRYWFGAQAAVAAPSVRRIAGDAGHYGAAPGDVFGANLYGGIVNIYGATAGPFAATLSGIVYPGPFATQVAVRVAP